MELRKLTLQNHVLVPHCRQLGVDILGLRLGLRQDVLIVQLLYTIVILDVCLRVVLRIGLLTV